MEQIILIIGILLLLLLIKKRKLSLSLIAILLIFYYTFRIIESIDDEGYQFIYNLIKVGQGANFIETSFVHIVKINLLIYDDIKITYFIYASLSFLFVTLTVNRVYKNKWELLIFFVYFAIFMIRPTTTLMRQFLALSIFSYALVMSNEKKNILYITLLLCISVYFHNSAIFAVPFFLLSKIKIKPIILILLLIVGIILGELGTLNIVINILASLGVYPEYSDPTGIDLYRIGILLTMLIMTGILNLLLRTNKKISMNNSSNAWYMYLFLYVIATQSGWASRLSLYFVIFVPFLFCEIIKMLKIDKVIEDRVKFAKT